MKLAKFILLFTTLTIIIVAIFGYGVVVGVYRLPPFVQIFHTKQILVKTIDNFISNKPPRNSKTSSFSESIRFISFGDPPYVRENEVEKYMSGLLEAINNQNPSLIFHVGDTFGTLLPCTNSMIDIQRELINSLNAPVLYTPGDNEWNDCNDETKPNDYNFDRLSYIRKTYFSQKQTLGKNKVFVENQSVRGYPENARLMLGNVAFITTHLIGPNNNFDPQSKQNTLEYFERDAANIDWIIESFSEYEKASAFVVAYHANIFKRKSLPVKPVFKKFSKTIYNLSNKYKKPVLILFGDSHKFQAFQPMPKKYPFLYAIQNFGDPDLKAIEIEVNGSKENPFRISKIITDTKIITDEKLINDEMYDNVSDYPQHCNLCLEK